MNIDVSLIIPLYNKEKYIKYTLESVQKQTLKNFECIVIDDKSTDSSFKILKETVKNDKRFRIIQHKKNSGLSASRNTGIRAARGRFIAFLDADDLIMEKSLEERYKKLIGTGDDVAGVYCGSISIDKKHEVAPKEIKTKLKIVDFLSTNGMCPFNANQPMLKVDIFKKVGGFDENLIQAEDYDMWIRILRNNYIFLPVDKALVTYRNIGSDSMIKSNPILHLLTSNKVYTDYYKNNNDFLLSKNINEYRNQVEFISRAVEFIGMQIAKNYHENITEILNENDLAIFYECIPDFTLLNGRYIDFFKVAKRGFYRFFGSDHILTEGLVSEIIQKALEKILNYYLKKENIKEEKNDIYDIIFFPHKDYHVQIIYHLIKYLQNFDLKYTICDISTQYRDEGVGGACFKYNLSKISYNYFVLHRVKTKSLVVFNDWDPILKSILQIAKRHKILTIGIVEGINDYKDDDINHSRFAYQTVDNLYLPGVFDLKYFNDSKQTIKIGGITRIFDLYHKPKNNISNKNILINSNFTYGVLEEYRDNWIKSAVEACLELGFQPIISKHPADKLNIYAEYVTNDSFYDALNKSILLISRFGSGILESLATQTPVIYFNPHGEKVDKFKEPNGAYSIANTTEDLKTLLSKTETFAIDKNKVEDFLNNHCGDLTINPAKKISKGLYIDLCSADKITNSLFFNELLELDKISNSLSDIKFLRYFVNNYIDCKTYGFNEEGSKYEIFISDLLESKNTLHNSNEKILKLLEIIRKIK